MGFLLATILLLAFAVLAVIDGFYLHIFRYQLFNYKESKLEYLIHTYRAILFPLIVYFLFMSQHCLINFYIGVSLVFLEVLILLVDAFVEKESRVNRGGLPRWEYILHLFVNGFHFALIAVFLVLKLSITNEGVKVINDLTSNRNYDFFYSTALNLLPGAIVIAIIHVLTSVHKTASYWNKIRAKITCC